MHPIAVYADHVRHFLVRNDTHRTGDYRIDDAKVVTCEAHDALSTTNLRVNEHF